MYYTLKNDISYDSDIYIRPPSALPEELDFMGGNRLDGSIDNPFVYTTNAVKGDEIRDFHDTQFLLMSKRFVDLLEAAGVDNLQKFPAVIKSEIDGTVWKDYYGVNVLGVISCADLENSKYNEIMPGHYIFKELAIFSEKPKGTLLFRLQEHCPSLIIEGCVIKHIISNDPDETLLGWEFDEIIQ